MNDTYDLAAGLTTASAYDSLADEYYDPSHKTSRNFDHTTRSALQTIDNPIPRVGMVLEVGAGKGRVGEFLGVDATRVIQLDNSLAMLALMPRESSQMRILHTAERLPFLEETFTAVVGFLADPFFGLGFLHESFRVLRPGGVLMCTLPSFEWGAPLREALCLPLHETRFVDKTGTEIRSPSHLFPAPSVKAMAFAAGFEERFVQVSKHALPEDVSVVSPDVEKSAAASGLPVTSLDLLYVLVATKGAGSR